MAWNPIETAPEGVRVLLRANEHTPPVVGTVEHGVMFRADDDDPRTIASVLHYNGEKLVPIFYARDWHPLPSDEPDTHPLPMDSPSDALREEVEQAVISAMIAGAASWDGPDGTGSCPPPSHAPFVDRILAALASPSPAAPQPQGDAPEAPPYYPAGYARAYRHGWTDGLRAVPQEPQGERVHAVQRLILEAVKEARSIGSDEILTTYTPRFMAALSTPPQEGEPATPGATLEAQQDRVSLTLDELAFACLVSRISPNVPMDDLIHSWETQGPQGDEVRRREARRAFEHFRARSSATPAAPQATPQDRVREHLREIKAVADYSLDDGPSTDAQWRDWMERVRSEAGAALSGTRAQEVRAPIGDAQGGWFPCVVCGGRVYNWSGMLTNPDASLHAHQSGAPTSTGEVHP